MAMKVRPPKRNQRASMGHSLKDLYGEPVKGTSVLTNREAAEALRLIHQAQNGNPFAALQLAELRLKKGV